MIVPVVADERGQVGGMEAAIFGVLVFVIGTLVIANAWGVIDAKVAAGSAAREATRAFVESPGPTAAEAMADAEDAAAATIAGHGRDRARMALIAESAEFARCGRVAFRVDYPVPLITVPLIGRFGRGFTVSARHSEIVDPYRSGIDEDGLCPSELVP